MFREVSDNSMLYTYVHETITSSAKLIDTFNILNRKLRCWYFTHTTEYFRYGVNYMIFLRIDFMLQYIRRLKINNRKISSSF